MRNLRSDGWSWGREKLHGSDVVKWFCASGWSVRKGTYRDHHAFIGEFSTPTVTVRRVWHTPVEADRAPDHFPTADPALGVWMHLGGDLFVSSHSGVEVPMPTGGAYFHARTPSSFRNTRPTARFELSLARLDNRRPERGAIIGRRDSATWSALAGVINAILNAREAPDIRTLALYAESIDTLVEALWFESVPVITSVDRDTFARALELITENSSDPTFTIEALASMLGVTRPHVTRLFRERGAMPSRILKRERVQKARKMLAIDPTTPLDTIARSSGFSSTRLLRESLRDRLPQETRIATPRAS